ncbi:methyltransferase domain-containing protein [Dactylosporangium sp. NPDC049140]|uniref:class I SAM-dependent methyltransferase n=1 Tax=Dactylosporangium sp. NPDC049140 TaxID=3155647 RepID=UPI0033EB91B8
MTATVDSRLAPPGWRCSCSPEPGMLSPDADSPFHLALIGDAKHHIPLNPFLRSFDLDRELVADFGCGTHRRDERVVCMDGGSYGNVDIVADLRRLPLAGDSLAGGISIAVLRRLPLAGDSLAGGISIAVLEHVPDPAVHIAEMHRVLRPGGRMLVFVPFMQPFHASPYDFQRYTEVHHPMASAAASGFVIEVRKAA